MSSPDTFNFDKCTVLSSGKELRKNRLICSPKLPSLWAQYTVPRIDWPVFNPLPKRQILDSSKVKVFAGDNFKLDKNGRKFSKWIENTVGKGEIARHEQFFLFPQCFQKASCTESLKVGIMW